MIRTQELTLPHALDPVPLYRALCTHFGRVNTLLLESADVHTKAGQKSFLSMRAALKFQAYKDRVVVDILTPLGEYLASQMQQNSSLPCHFASPKQLVFAILRADNAESLSSQLQKKSCLDVLRDTMKLHALAPETDPALFLVAGIFAYDLVDHFEELPGPLTDPNEFPDYVFWFPEAFVVIDHIHGKTQILQHALREEEFVIANAVKQYAAEGSKSHGLPPFVRTATGSGSVDAGTLASVDVNDADFVELVAFLKNHVVCGDVFQIVPSRTFRMPCMDSLLAYEHLKAINPSPYMYYVVDENFELAGASPETFIKLDAKSRQVEVKPIAGTRKRGIDKKGVIDPELDARLEAELRLDTKELAEHMMLVDLARNDIARVSQLGTRKVQRLLSVERYSHVMHLVSQVSGELREDLDGLHAYQASLNMGTLVGAPKIKAAQILRRHEHSKRGTYGGAIGYLDASGNFDTAIIIRSAFIKGDTAFVRAGAGVVYDSIPVAEAAETKSKASAVLSAIHAANLAARGALS